MKETRFDYFTYQEYLDVAVRDLETEKGYQGSPELIGAMGERSSRTGESSFTKTESWDNCVKLVDHGWKKGREQVGKILARIKTREDEIEKPQIIWDVEGDMVDIGRFVSGEPECMMHWEEEKIQKRIARILFPVSVSAGVSTELMQWRGATVLALIDRLEASGVRCHVDICYAMKERGGCPAWFLIANVKEAGEILHLDRMAFHLAHPSSFRRVMFSLAENGPPDFVQGHGTHGKWGGYGMPIQNVKPYLTDNMDYDLVCPGAHLSTVDQSVKEIEQMFNTVCPPIKHTGESEWETDKM